MVGRHVKNKQYFTMKQKIGEPYSFDRLSRLHLHPFVYTHTQAHMYAHMHATTIKEEAAINFTVEGRGQAEGKVVGKAVGKKGRK